MAGPQWQRAATRESGAGNGPTTWHAIVVNMRQDHVRAASVQQLTPQQLGLGE
jgi:hypothetical protein